MESELEEHFARPRVVVITGGTAGVGRATVREYAKKGAKLAILARGEKGLTATKIEAEALGATEARTYQVDVADADAIEKAAGQIEEELGEIDVWVNNAMTSVFAPFMEIEPNEFKRVTDVCYHGQVYGTLAALKRMKPRNRGAIVLVGSALAYRGIPLQSAYCGAKHAIQGFFDSVRAELLHDNSKVKFSMVQLPAMNTPQFGWVRSKLPNKARPMGTIFQPEVAARAIVFAAKSGRREVFVGYTTLQAIYGNKLAPGIGDHVLADGGYKGQQTDEPEDPNREDNLFSPVEGDHGAHGSFSENAWERSPELWLSKNRGPVAAAAAGLGVLAGLIALRK